MCCFSQDWHRELEGLYTEACSELRAATSDRAQSGPSPHPAVDRGGVYPHPPQAGAGLLRQTHRDDGWEPTGGTQKEPRSVCQGQTQMFV